ncbi:cysteine proteinase [Daedalea quercina L-15889]|uniref:ubiquitinyl hydrolase 1 n=1 Tax=Daedalea quercina L-15889 TaxID=1314783 RepID=A0A165R5W7_9APHY|nr:cysteine proteinase [Daedalea quercina L-15889]
MQPLEDFRYLLLELVSSPAFQQLFPLFFVLLVPLLVFTANSRKGSIVSSTFMVLEALSGALPWNWFDSHSGSNSTHEKRKSKKKHIRTRLQQEQHQLEPLPKASYDGCYYPGLVNISGTYCFLDSTLQAMASLCYLQPQIEHIHAKAEALDVPTPVIDALRDLLNTLNTPTSAPQALRPLDIIDALSKNSPSKHNTLFSSREHQDAQELFQLLSECIKNEAAAVEKEGHRDRGLGALGQAQGPASRELGKNVFDGLTANRRSCVECGYTEAVMHFAFDNWQLNMPRMACRLEDCLDDYTRLEILTDCICRKCSMLATYRRLEAEAEKLTDLANADQDPSTSKKKRAREARKLVARMKAALDDGRIEEDIKGVKMEKVFSRASTKQAMIARPPRVLALHLNRSVHYGHYASKNTCRVIFPEVLDLTPYTTSGQLSTSPSVPISTPPPVPISTPPPSIPRSTTPTPAAYATPRTIYRLSAVVCHYGQHSFGHYVCFRRKPRPPSAGPRRFNPPKLACPLGCDCERCDRYGPVRDDEDESPKPGRGWLRISDDSVSEVGIESVLQEGVGAFMLFYERVVMPRQNIYLSNSPRSSEETVRPEGVHANGSCASLVNGDAAQEVKVIKPIPKIVGPRVIHRVSAQPSSRGQSLSPPDRDPVPRPRTQTQPLASNSTTPERSLLNGQSAPSGKNHAPNTLVEGSVPSKVEDAQPAPVRPVSPQQQTTSPTSPAHPSRLTKHHAQARSLPSISSPTEPLPSPSIAVDLRA